MSHIVTIELSIDSLDTLESACKSLGCKLVRGETRCRSYYRDAVKGCEHVVKVKGAEYDVAVVPLKDRPGRWTLAYDPWMQGRGLHAALGEGLGKLKQRYAVERSRQAMRRQGWAVREKTLADGQVQLMCTR